MFNFKYRANRAPFFLSKSKKQDKKSHMYNNIV